MYLFYYSHFNLRDFNRPYVLQIFLFVCSSNLLHYMNHALWWNSILFKRFNFFPKKMFLASLSFDSSLFSALEQKIKSIKTFNKRCGNAILKRLESSKSQNFQGLRPLTPVGQGRLYIDVYIETSLGGGAYNAPQRPPARSMHASLAFLVISENPPHSNFSKLETMIYHRKVALFQ